jgi:hypothetical protein
MYPVTTHRFRNECPSLLIVQPRYFQPSPVSLWSRCSVSRGYSRSMALHPQNRFCWWLVETWWLVSKCCLLHSAATQMLHLQSVYVVASSRSWCLRLPVLILLLTLRKLTESRGESGCGVCRWVVYVCSYGVVLRLYEVY